MPYHIKKVGSRFKVVDDKGREYSKKGLTKAKALAQQKALYATAYHGSGYCSYSDDDGHHLLLEGGGFFSDIFAKAKQIATNAYQTVATRVSDVAKGIREDYPPDVRETIAKYGSGIVEELLIRREPIQSFINKALNLVSLGKWNQARNELSYDQLYHLSMIATLKMTDGSEARLIIEKNEVINISPNFSMRGQMEMLKVPVPCCITLKEMLDKAQAIQGPKFFLYDAFTNNCQMFLMSILDANNLTTPQVKAFVLQDVDSLLKRVPKYVSPFAKSLTNIAGLFNVALKGRGECCGECEIKGGCEMCESCQGGAAPIVMPAKSYYAEHKRLIGLLNDISERAKAEADEQTAEIEQRKQGGAKLFSGGAEQNEIVKILLGGSEEPLDVQNQKLLKQIENLQKQNKDLEFRLAEELERTTKERQRHKKSFEDYDTINLTKFLKTQDEVLTNPEIYEYDEEMTAFDKNLKKNPNYYRKYQKEFIQDWSVSSQETVILYYGVGSGKTMIAVNCAEQFTVLNNNAHVYFLTPASLVLNTIKEMYRRGIDPNRKNEAGEHIYYFVSYQQLLNSNLEFKPNSLLIIDEVHNMRNFKTKTVNERVSARKWEKTGNFSLVGTKLGITLLKNENKFLRTIFMTGTLFVNSQYDLEPIIALGYKKTPLYEADKDELKIIESDPKEFKNYYQGLMSYYSIPNTSKEFPRKKYEFVPILSSGSEEIYTMTEHRAKSIIANNKKSKNPFDEDYIEKLKNAVKTNNYKGLYLELPEKDAYYIRSRNESNMEKGKWIIDFLMKHKNEKTLIYSQFRDYSIEPLLQKLANSGIKYGFINGSLSQEKKLMIVNEYNTNKINVLFFTLSIKEGISFKETKNIIVNEPYWNYAIMEQIIARGIRLDSHALGDKSTINLYMLISVPKDANKRVAQKWCQESSDIMNKDIKTLKYETKEGQKFSRLGKIDDVETSSLSRDISIYNMMFNKQESINVFETKLKSVPSFENVNNVENNDFIKAFNERIIELEKEGDVTNAQRVKIKREMYKSFYAKNLSSIDTRIKRFNEDYRYREVRNPDITEQLDSSEYKDKTDKIRQIIKSGGDLNDIFAEFKITKKDITMFQANFTPKAQVELILDESEISQDKRDKIMVLEPTCGIGNVIGGLMNLPNKQNIMCDGNELHQIFYQTATVIYENIDNIKFTNIDFMRYQSKYNYDYILGNPPFNIKTTQKKVNKKGDIVTEDVTLYDVDFVAKAYNLLNKGGKLTMIISDKFQRENDKTSYVNFNKYVKYLEAKNMFKIADVHNFRKEKGVTKEMETNFGMKCITMIKDEFLKMDLSKYDSAIIERDLPKEKQTPKEQPKEAEAKIEKQKKPRNRQRIRERLRGGVGAEGFNEFIQSTGLTQPSEDPYAKMVAPNQYEVITKPTDTIQFDKEKYDKLMSAALSKQEFEAKQGNRRGQTYDEYIKNLQDASRARATTNVTAAARSDKETERHKNILDVYNEYIRLNPHLENVRCYSNAEGDPVPGGIEVPKYQCDANNKARQKKEYGSTFFGKVTQGLTDVADWIVDNVGSNLPGVGKVISEGYKMFAPPTSKFAGGSKKKWIQEVVKHMKKGTFTKQAKKAGMEPDEFAQHVLANKEKYNLITRRRAQFLQNILSKKKVEGGCADCGNISAQFKKQLDKIGLSPKEYLDMAKHAAKKNGYDPNDVKLSNDPKHKIEVKGSKAGRVGYGDFIIWSYLEKMDKVPKGTASLKQNVFHKSHSKIKGDWKADKYSPNNLALKILW